VSVNPRISTLAAIRLLHTVIWAFLAASIVAIPVVALTNHLRWAAALSVIVLVECIIIVVNQGKCPLTAVAARYTENRADNFDIYLPVWLARHNKEIFGTLFVAGELIFLWKWLL
jgi:hypothetical protein